VAVNPLAPKLEHAVEFVVDEAESELVLVVDQFEEVWTLANGDDRARFVALLAGLVADESMNLRVVCAIRADFFDRPLSEPQLGSLVARNSFAVTPMTAAELSEAVREPANAAAVAFEPGLDAEIVADVIGQPASLPLLQFALAELYERRQGARIPSAAYRAMGGVAGAVAARAETVFDGLDAHGQREARRLFSRLVTPGIGAEDTRRRARRSDLPDTANTIADQFVTHRLLVVDHDPATREPTLDIAHEALLVRWPRLREWLEDDREQLLLMQHLSQAAQEWNDAGRRESDLYRGPRLEIAGEISDAGNVIFAPSEDEFLSASRAAHEAERARETARVAQQARQNSRLRRALAVAAVTLLAALVAGGLALNQRNRIDVERALADRRAQEATAARDEAEGLRALADRRADDATAASHEADIARLVAQSQSDSRLSPTRALLLAAEAYNREQSWRTAGALQTAIASVPKGTLGYLEGIGSFSDVEHGKSVIVGRDGDALAFWSASTYRRLGEIRDPAMTHQGQISLSSDDRYVATGTSQGFVVFEVTTKSSVGRVTTTSPATAIAFNPLDVEHILVGQSDGSVEVVRWRTGQTEMRYPNQSSRIMSVSYSSDGRRASASTNDGRAQAFDTATGEPISAALRFVPRLPVTNFVFARLSRSGTYLIASGVAASQTIVQRIADSALVFEHTNTTDPSAPLNADLIEATNTLVIAQNTGELLFNLDTKQQLPSTSLPSSLIYIDVAISPDAKTMAVSSASEISIRALDARQLGAEASLAQPAGFSARPGTALSFNQDRTKLLLGGEGVSYLYDLTTTPAAVRQVDFAGPGALVHARFAGQGRFIETLHINVTGSSAYQQWDPATLRATALVTLPGAIFDKRSGIASSPDGRFVAASNAVDALVKGGRPTVRVFDVQTGELRWAFTDLYDIVTGILPQSYLVPYSIAFSPDSRFVAATSFGGGALAVWELATGRVTPIATSGASTIAYAPNGDLLVIGANYRLSVLDTASLKSRLELAGRAGASLFGAFHPSKQLLLTDNGCGKPHGAGSGWGLQLWDLERRVDVGVGLAVWCAAWSFDGDRFAAMDDTTIQIWSTDWNQWKRAACAAAGRNLTENEWRTYVSDTQPRDTCAD
jgi:WD40 repeat protein